MPGSLVCPSTRKNIAAVASSAQKEPRPGRRPTKVPQRCKKGATGRARRATGTLWRRCVWRRPSSVTSRAGVCRRVPLPVRRRRPFSGIPNRFSCRLRGGLQRLDLQAASLHTAVAIETMLFCVLAAVPIGVEGGGLTGRQPQEEEGREEHTSGASQRHSCTLERRTG